MMESRTLQLLEFPKVLAVLADRAVSESGRRACQDVEPLSPTLLAVQVDVLEQGLAWAFEANFRLSPFPDIEPMLDSLSGAGTVLDLDDLAALGLVLEQARQARQSLEDFQARPVEELKLSLFYEAWPAKTAQALQRCIDPEGALRDASSPELAEARSDIRRIHRQCVKKIKDEILGAAGSHILQDEYLTISSDRYVLALKTNFKGRLTGIVHDYSQTGETCYFEPMALVDLNNELQEFKRREREEELKVLKYLTSLVREELESVRCAYDSLVRLDVLMAKARLAQDMDGCVLRPHAGAPLDLRQARHPLLALSSHGARPLDLSLGEGRLGLVISGGNAGGKTVCLKTLGLVALMAQSLLPVPVREGSSIPYWDKIFVVMGDEQSLESSVSTFTAQIRYLSRIFDQADESSLFLLDEFGAGTDPSQGAALAQAVLDSLVERGACAAAATHFPALKAYALAHEHIRAASVLFDPTTKKPMFQLAYDQVGASIALEVAREHGLPAQILERAEKYLLLEGSDTTSVLEKLNALAVRREKELAGLDAEHRRMAEERAKLKERFKRESAKLLADINSQAQQIVREWKAGRVSRKKALKELAEQRKQLAGDQPRASEKAAPEALDEVKAGVQAVYAPWEREGLVLEINEKKRQAKIDVGGVSLWANWTDLRPCAVAPAGGGELTASTAPESEITARVDLRGHRAHEAVSELAAQLDRALLQGATQVEVIHGRGTGALRREVHEFLRSSPVAKSFELADEEHGGDGMTMVELK
jgi:DNA mismatch repair protein MutS2